MKSFKVVSIQRTIQQPKSKVTIFSNREARPLVSIPELGKTATIEVKFAGHLFNSKFAKIGDNWFKSGKLFNDSPVIHDLMSAILDAILITMDEVEVLDIEFVVTTQLKFSGFKKILTV